MYGCATKIVGVRFRGNTQWFSRGWTYTYKFNELRDILCGEAKMSFNADQLYLFGLADIGWESKKIWTTRTIALEGIDFQKHPGACRTF